MPIEFKNDCAFFLDAVSVEEAEGLLEWLQRMPSATVDLSGCCHLHTANLQVLMAAKPAISNWPEDEKLRAWLEAALPISAETALPADKDKEERRTVDRRKRQRTTAPHKERRKSVSPYIKG